MDWDRYSEGGVRTAFRRVILWYGVMLATGLTLAWIIDIHINPAAIVAGALFFYVDIFGIDGGSVYALAKIVGGRAGFEKHVGFVSWWKPPILVLQVLGILLGVAHPAGIVMYYVFIAAELAMFWVTFRKIHRLSAWKSALLVAAILAVMIPAFLTDTAIRELTNFLL
ncbi:MAG: hypothetical protein PWP76_519 [Candidatus Diapherotrites archaeon]|nr:hypothetical protein [Candidatus Diapherotrites archaeon]MDN5367186.1 hypothetical protein [Candidatus Diapherotrites archaeon]